MLSNPSGRAIRSRSQSLGKSNITYTTIRRMDKIFMRNPALIISSMEIIFEPKTTALGGVDTQQALGNLPGALDTLHFAPKAKRVIFLHQNGAPSQHDLFDYKPELEKLRGQKPCIKVLNKKMPKI